MAQDVEFFKQHGADGIVFGCLDSKSQIDVENCQKIIAAWGNSKPMTFHRAFDETLKEDYQKNIDLLIGMGFCRVLSSGYEISAERGIENIKKMINYSSGTSLSIMSGAGINVSNVAKIISETGCKEIHTSARSEMKSLVTNNLSMGGSDNDFQALMICDPVKVNEIIKIAKSFSS
jgi:copper homeostasis protein